MGLPGRTVFRDYFRSLFGLYRCGFGTSFRASPSPFEITEKFIRQENFESIDRRVGDYLIIFV